jgi:hypothetical protein
MINLEKRIKKFLKDRKIPVKDFCEALEISPANLYNIYKRNSIDSKYLERFSSVYKLDISYLISSEYTNQQEYIDVKGKMNAFEQENENLKREVKLLRELLESKNEIIQNLKKNERNERMKE